MTRRNLYVLFFTMFLFVFGFGLYDDLFPIHARNLGATPVQLGFLFTVRQLTITAGSILGGLAGYGTGLVVPIFLAPVVGVEL